jgi:hypothetical protein
MAIDFTKTFGTNNTSTKSSAPAANSHSDKPKAAFWLNVGYDSGVTDEEGESRFVSLPVGIPLDTQDKLPTNSRNKDFAAFQAARNDLLDQLMELAHSMEPGEERILNLQLQLRRVNDVAPEASLSDNKFARKLSLVG